MVSSNSTRLRSLARLLAELCSLLPSLPVSGASHLIEHFEVILKPWRRFWRRRSQKQASARYRQVIDADGDAPWRARGASFEMPRYGAEPKH